MLVTFWPLYIQFHTLHTTMSVVITVHITQQWKYALQMAQYNTGATNPTEFRRVLRDVNVHRTIVSSIHFHIIKSSTFSC
jgi:hypothetical protein